MQISFNYNQDEGAEEAEEAEEAEGAEGGEESAKKILQVTNVICRID